MIMLVHKSPESYISPIITKFKNQGKNQTRNILQLNAVSQRFEDLF